MNWLPSILVPRPVCRVNRRTSNWNVFCLVFSISTINHRSDFNLQAVFQVYQGTWIVQLCLPSFFESNLMKRRNSDFISLYLTSNYRDFHFIFTVLFWFSRFRFVFRWFNLSGCYRAWSSSSNKLTLWREDQ